MDKFSKEELKKLYKPPKESEGEDNGQVTIIGGSKLFHGAPILSLKVASRISDMVFFASPEESVGKVAEKIKSELLSFIWVPWDEVESYVEKSDAILIGPGFMRFSSEKVPHGKRNHVCDEACQKTKKITRGLLEKFPNKKWVIDAGSLQVMEKSWIPEGSILTPNKKEYELLFGDMEVERAAKETGAVISLKGPTSTVCSKERCVEVDGGNPGLTKGGTGDVYAGLTVSLFAKNNAFLASASANYITKKAAEKLYEEVGTNYSAEDLADKLPEVFFELTS